VNDFWFFGRGGAAKREQSQKRNPLFSFSLIFCKRHKKVSLSLSLRRRRRRRRTLERQARECVCACVCYISRVCAFLFYVGDGKAQEKLNGVDKKKMQTLNYFFVSLKNSSTSLTHQTKKKDDTLKDSRTRGALLLEDFRKRRRSRRAALLPFLVSSFFTFAIVVVVVHAHTERKSFQNSFLGKKRNRGRGGLENRNERARGFS
jgi:hypothetical protein